jgi:GTPase
VTSLTTFHNSIDEVQLLLSGGKGGQGCISFKREKFLPKGGPDGGDGGMGGSVWLEADKRLMTLRDLLGKRSIQASMGGNGLGQKCHGRNGDDFTLKVPLGTIIYVDQEPVPYAELLTHGQRVCMVKGGEGGLGNVHFKRGTQRVPYMKTDGGEGESCLVRLSLQILADVGFIGPPNAGKSTLLRLISDARPEVGNYPFTTKTPQLGMITDGIDAFTVADVPGLLPGAESGYGLGNRFLKHLTRCRMLVYVLPVGQKESLIDCFQSLRTACEVFGQQLDQKPWLIVASQWDLFAEVDQSNQVQIEDWLAKMSQAITVIKTSYQDQDSTNKLLAVLFDKLKKVS